MRRSIVSVAAGVALCMPLLWVGTGLATAGTSVATTTVATSTALSASVASGPAYQAVVLSAVVTAADQAPTLAGTCTFADNGVTLAAVPVSGGGDCAYVSTSFGPGPHGFVASFAPTGDFAPSTSVAVEATYDEYDCVSGDLCEDPRTVIPTVPRGELSILTPYTPATPFDLGTVALVADGSSYEASAAFGTPDRPEEGLTIVDTRSAALPFTAQVAATVFADGTNTLAGSVLGFTGVSPGYIAGNGINADTRPVVVNDVTVIGTRPLTFATGSGPGTVFVLGTLGLRRVPTSAVPGRYTATLTFTIS